MMVTRCIFALFVALAGVSGTVGETTLTVAQLATHKHNMVERPEGANRHHTGEGGAPYLPGMTDNAGSSQPHTHTLSGASGAASGLPPYYALAYVMRIA